MSEDPKKNSNHTDSKTPSTTSPSPSKLTSGQAGINTETVYKYFQVGDYSLKQHHDFSPAPSSRSQSRTSSIASSDDESPAPTNTEGSSREPNSSAPQSQKYSRWKRIIRMKTPSVHSVNADQGHSNLEHSNEMRKGTSSKASSVTSENFRSSSTQPVVCARFTVLPEGTHCHRLRAAKRHEKLKDIIRDFMAGGQSKRKEVIATQNSYEAGPGELSLLRSFVDEVKNQNEGNKKLDSMSLFQKYGRLQEVVGRGSFGIVRISHKIDPKNSNVELLYAVKEFFRRPNESEKRYTKRLTSEFCISSSLKHPNIIHTLDLVKDAKGVYCEVMEYCAGGDLYTLILANGKLLEPEANCYFKQLIRGVEYMHSMGVSHRDLKPENLLLTQTGALKITDFGNGECFRMAWENECHLTSGLCGSAPYIAPEEYTEPEFDPRSVDVWACGVIYMAMRTGRHLWRAAKPDDEYYANYLSGRKSEAGYEPIELLRQRNCKNIVYSILDPTPSRRMTANQLIQTDWVKEIILCKAGETGG